MLSTIIARNRMHYFALSFSLSWIMMSEAGGGQMGLLKIKLFNFFVNFEIFEVLTVKIFLKKYFRKIKIL